MKSLRGLIAILIVIVVLAGCSGEGANKAGTPSSPPVTAESSPQAAPEVEETVPTPPEVASPAASASSSSSVATPQDETPPKVDSPAPSSPAGSGEKKPEVDASAKPSEPDALRITLSIIWNEEWGTIVDGEQVDLKEGDTAASVLKRVAKAHRLAYEIRGSGALTYIEGIDGLYEFDNGPTSGWKFRVNGVFADIGAGVYELEPGDRLEWIYVNNDELAASGEESAP